MKFITAVARILLAGAPIFAGVGHLTTSRTEFQAQVPTWVPLDPDFVVIASGVVEIVLGVLLLVAKRYRRFVGWTTAAFFVAIFRETSPNTSLAPMPLA